MARKGAGFCDRALLRALWAAMASAGVEHWYRGRKETSDVVKTLLLSARQMHDILDKIITHADNTLRDKVRRPASAHAKCQALFHLQVFQGRGLPEEDTLASRYARQLLKHATKSGLNGRLTCM